MFRTFKRPKVRGVTASPDVAHMINLIAIRDVTVVHLEDCAVEHFHLVVVAAGVAPGLPEVSILVELVRDGYEAACFHLYEMKRLRLMVSGFQPTCCQPCIRQRGDI